MVSIPGSTTRTSRPEHRPEAQRQGGSSSYGLYTRIHNSHQPNLNTDQRHRGREGAALMVSIPGSTTRTSRPEHRPEAQRQGGSSSLWSLYQDLQLAPADLNTDQRHRGREGAALYGLYTRIYNSHQPT